MKIPGFKTIRLALLVVFLMTSSSFAQQAASAVKKPRPMRVMPANLVTLYQRLEKSYRENPQDALKHLAAFKDLGFDCENGLVGYMRPWLKKRGMTDAAIREAMDVKPQPPVKNQTRLFIPFVSEANASLSSVEMAAFTHRLTTTHFELYTEDAAVPDDAYVTSIGDVLETAYTSYVTSYGFAAPNGGSSVAVYIHTVSGANGSASTSGYIELDPDLTDDANHRLYYVPAHELFHLVQYEMFDTNYEVFTEGGARWAEDVVNADYDGYNTYTSNFGWIGNMESVVTSYAFALFWRYMTDEMTAMTDTADPSYGTDVMIDFYTYLGSLGTSVVLSDMDGALTSLTGRSFSMATFYRDFLIAVFAKDLADPFAPPYSPASGNPRWDFLEDEEASYSDLDYYRDGDSLASGGSVSYTNSGEYYSATWSSLSWDGFVSYGDAEYARVNLDAALTQITFTPSNVDNANIYYAVAIQYEKISDGSAIVRSITGLSPSSAARAIDIYGGKFTAAKYRPEYLVVIPFTLDPDPYDGDGNNFSYTVTGL